VRGLAGKTAVVTGAASGIGRALAERLLSERMNVVLADVETEALDRTARELGARGSLIAVRTDVSRAEDVQALADATLQAFGAVHVLCNNAGVGIGGALWEHTVKDWEWLLGVNLWGVIHGVRTFVPVMLKQGDECHIVNTASAAGLDARPWLGVYSASKYAVVAISEALREELRMTGAKIGVSVLCPAVVNTRIGEAERNRPEDLRNAAEAEAPPQAQAFGEAFRALLASGIPPEDVAGAVVDAIREDRLYIVTSKETDSRVRARVDRILNDASMPLSERWPG
jgi:NAD(P)-dependent dehydrogenase (short-subunit alcohol dehydrogenase family)